MQTWTDAKHPSRTRIYAGSGDYHFFNLLTHEPHGMTGVVSEYEAQMADLSDIIMRASGAILNEFADNQMHWYQYGGGFEILVTGDFGFEKVPSTLVIWREYAPGEIELTGPVISNHYSENGILSIRRFVKVGSEWKQSTFPVRHLLHEGDEIGHLDPRSDTNTIATVHHFLSDGQTKTVQKLSLKPDFKINFDGVTFSVTDNGDIRNHLRRFPKRPSK